MNPDFPKIGDVIITENGRRYVCVPRNIISALFGADAVYQEESPEHIYGLDGKAYWMWRHAYDRNMPEGWGIAKIIQATPPELRTMQVYCSVTLVAGTIRIDKSDARTAKSNIELTFDVKARKLIAAKFLQATK